MQRFKDSKMWVGKGRKMCLIHILWSLYKLRLWWDINVLYLIININRWEQWQGKKKKQYKITFRGILFQSSCVGVSFLKRMRFTQQYQYCDSIYRTLNKLNMVLVKMHTNAFHTWKRRVEFNHSNFSITEIYLCNS